MSLRHDRYVYMTPCDSEGRCPGEAWFEGPLQTAMMTKTKSDDVNRPLANPLMKRAALVPKERSALVPRRLTPSATPAEGMWHEDPLRRWSVKLRRQAW